MMHCGYSIPCHVPCSIPGVATPTPRRTLSAYRFRGLASGGDRRAVGATVGHLNFASLECRSGRVIARELGATTVFYSQYSAGSVVAYSSAITLHRVSRAVACRCRVGYASLTPLQAQPQPHHRRGLLALRSNRQQNVRKCGALGLGEVNRDCAAHRASAMAEAAGVMAEAAGSVAGALRMTGASRALRLLGAPDMKTVTQPRARTGTNHTAHRESAARQRRHRRARDLTFPAHSM